MTRKTRMVALALVTLLTFEQAARSVWPTALRLHLLGSSLG